jgi:tRNA pseudouridine32 synthase / 23S rRNA pseudouridine746 synthase
MTDNYYYQGWCPRSQKIWKLPRTDRIENIARKLMLELDRQESKMYGVLLAKTPGGAEIVLKAFSGLLAGKSTHSGWVPPISAQEVVALQEAQTLIELAQIKQELIELENISCRQTYQELKTELDRNIAELTAQHRLNKLDRDRQRAAPSLELKIAALEQQSQREKSIRNQAKRDRDHTLTPLKIEIDRADARIAELRAKRKQLSRQLQHQMHQSTHLLNFLGTAASLRELMPAGIPTGTGDCCAPKLLHYAATHQLQPLAMAEFWWGEDRHDKISGQFYPACQERCEPLMGFMLSGLGREIIPPIAGNLEILAEQRRTIAVIKPSGLLSVPGRYRDRQDSVLTRLQALYPQERLYPIHRLDWETSGILLFARDLDAYRYIARQFQQRQVRKIYTAVLAGIIDRDRGEINLPLKGDPDLRPRQQVDLINGKPSITHFRTIDRGSLYTQIEFIPLTGRTHQLRVHSADRRGLGVPILGDRLYGNLDPVDRLYLHARELTFIDPDLEGQIHLHSPIDFTSILNFS